MFAEVQSECHAVSGMVSSFAMTLGVKVDVPQLTVQNKSLHSSVQRLCCSRQKCR